MKPSIRKRELAIRAAAAKIQQAPPPNVAANMLNFMVCLRYWESVLRHSRLRNYLHKHRKEELQELLALLKESTRRHAKRTNGACAKKPAEIYLIK